VATYKAGLAVNQSVPDSDGYDGNFDAEFKNFWTNSSYYCIFSGLGLVPENAYPRIRHSDDSRRKAERMFQSIKQAAVDLKVKLPTNYQFLRHLHGTGV
jgi:tryptophan halogenase